MEMVMARTIPLFTLLVLAGCGASDEEEAETAIREGLSQRGTVLQVELTPQGEDRMTGFAILRNHAGTQVRMNCTVEPQGEGSMMRQGFSWRCQPA
jgi:hypothetical protein